MGQIFTASCDCGYTKDDIYVGGGMLNFQTYDPFPHYCPKCKIIFEGNLRGEEPICCDECGSGDVFSYFDKKICKPVAEQQTNTKSNSSNSIIDRTLRVLQKVFQCCKGIEETKVEDDILPKHNHMSSSSLEKNKFLCPACGNFSLSFESHISYD